MGGSLSLGSDPPITLGPHPGLEESFLTWSCSLALTMHFRLAQRQLIWEKEGASPRSMHRHLLPICEVSPKMVLRKCRGHTLQPDLTGHCHLPRQSEWGPV